MTYKLPEETPVFSYTPQELFDCITKIIAHPHTVVTDHDKSRAMAIFLTFADYLGNYTESDNNGCHCVYECDSTDFEGFVMEMMNEEMYGTLNANQILK